MKKTDWKSCLRVCACVFLLYLAVHYWPWVSGVIKTLFSASSPLLIGFAIAYIINILMCFFERHLFRSTEKKFWKKLCTPVSLGLSFLVLVALIALVVGLVLPQLILCIKLLLDSLPAFTRKVIAILEQNFILSETVLPLLKDINWQDLINKSMGILSDGISGAMSFLTNFVSGTINAFLSLIFAVYLLLAKKKLLSQFHRVTRAFLPRTVFHKGRHVLGILNFTFRKYIAGQCIEAIILGALCYVGMTILQLPYAMMIGAFIAMTALVPIAGAYIGGAVGAVMIFTVSPWKALIFLIFLIVLQQLEGNLIYPRVVGSSMGLPGIWVLASITIGGGLMGILGMLLGVPVAATLYYLLEEALQKREETLEREEGEAFNEPEEPFEPAEATPERKKTDRESASENASL